jgi:hypothetical protein
MAGQECNMLVVGSYSSAAGRRPDCSVRLTSQVLRYPIAQMSCSRTFQAIHQNHCQFTSLPAQKWTGDLVALQLQFSVFTEKKGKSLADDDLASKPSSKGSCHILAVVDYQSMPWSGTLTAMKSSVCQF